jgi:hypothetical protein
VIKDISIQYAKGGGYLQPVYVFEGDAYPYKIGAAPDKFAGREDAILR